MLMMNFYRGLQAVLVNSLSDVNKRDVSVETVVLCQWEYNRVISDY